MCPTRQAIFTQVRQFITPLRHGQPVTLTALLRRLADDGRKLLQMRAITQREPLIRWEQSSGQTSEKLFLGLRDRRAPLNADRMRISS